MATASRRVIMALTMAPLCAGQVGAVLRDIPAS
jgi:hypothetical protein